MHQQHPLISKIWQSGPSDGSIMLPLELRNTIFMYGSFKERCWNQIINKTGWVNWKKYKIEAVEIPLVLNFPHLSQQTKEQFLYHRKLNNPL